jgi:hypothetical protein
MSKVLEPWRKMARFHTKTKVSPVTACLLAASPKRHICLEGSDGFVTSTAAPIVTGWSDPVAGWELHPLKNNTFTRRTLVLKQANARLAHWSYKGANR